MFTRRISRRRSSPDGSRPGRTVVRYVHHWRNSLPHGIRQSEIRWICALCAAASDRIIERLPLLFCRIRSLGSERSANESIIDPSTTGDLLSLVCCSQRLWAPHKRVRAFPIRTRHCGSRTGERTRLRESRGTGRYARGAIHVGTPGRSITSGVRTMSAESGRSRIVTAPRVPRARYPSISLLTVANRIGDHALPSP